MLIVYLIPPLTNQPNIKTPRCNNFTKIMKNSESSYAKLYIYIVYLKFFNVLKARIKNSGPSKRSYAFKKNSHIYLYICEQISLVKKRLCLNTGIPLLSYFYKKGESSISSKKEEVKQQHRITFKVFLFFGYRKG